MVEHPQAALTPALINAHIHLELSHLAELAKKPLTTTFTGWIVAACYICVTRSRSDRSPGRRGRQLTLHRAAILNRGRVCFCRYRQHQCGPATCITSFAGDSLLSHKEYLGLASGLPWQKNLQPLTCREEPEDTRCSVPTLPIRRILYLIQALKRRGLAALATIFSPFTSLNPWPVKAKCWPRGMGRDGGLCARAAASGMARLSLPGNRRLNPLSVTSWACIDERTLSVYMLSIWTMGKRSGSLAGEGGKSLSLPGKQPVSYRSATAPLEALPWRQASCPALGTDSVASNPELSIWREMALHCNRTHPHVEAAQYLCHGYQGRGAAALGIDKEIQGVLRAGKKADVLAVPIPVSIQLTVRQQLMHHLVTAENKVPTHKRVFVLRRSSHGSHRHGQLYQRRPDLRSLEGTNPFPQTGRWSRRSPAG